MKLWSRAAREKRVPVKRARICAWTRRLALLTFALVGPLGIHLQGHQGPQDAPFTVSIADAGGGAVPDVDVVLMRQGTYREAGRDRRTTTTIRQPSPIAHN
jgi:hypothetical protein